MFLLLRHQPQTATLSPDRHSGTTDEVGVRTSSLWHARRVCGIAVSSDPHHTRCWDPSMIAAFALTARLMTHPSQQKELLACLQHVKASGWRVDGLVRSLREEWGRLGPR